MQNTNKKNLYRVFKMYVECNLKPLSVKEIFFGSRSVSGVTNY